MTLDSDSESQPIKTDLRAAIKEASFWYACLNSDDVTDTERQQWHDWLKASRQHQLAWQQVEAISDQLNAIPGDVASPALQQTDISRRKLLTKLGVLAMLVPSSWLLYRAEPWHQWNSDLATTVGETQEHKLADGSVILLDTDTVVNIQFNDSERLISLKRGRIMIETHPDITSPARPFFVQTSHGKIEALGTRFTVFIENNKTGVVVLEEAVRISVSSGYTSTLIKGQQVRFTRDSIGSVQKARTGAGSWASGSLVVVDMPLGELVKELSRYRAGVLSYDQSVASLKISGAFPLSDTDSALKALVDTFPVRQRRLTRYWVKLIPK